MPPSCQQTSHPISKSSGGCVGVGGDWGSSGMGGGADCCGVMGGGASTGAGAGADVEVDAGACAGAGDGVGCSFADDGSAGAGVDRITGGGGVACAGVAGMIGDVAVVPATGASG